MRRYHKKVNNNLQHCVKQSLYLFKLGKAAIYLKCWTLQLLTVRWSH